MYLFLAFGLGSNPGWPDCCAKEMLGISRLQIPFIQIIDFAADWKLGESTSAHEELVVGMEASKCLLDRLGARYHAR